MRSGPSLRGNFSWTFAGNMVYAACQWGMLTVLARLGSPGVVGQFALGLAIATPVMMFTSLQLRQIQATDARGEYHFADYLGLRLATVGPALLTILAIAGGAGYRRETAMVIVAMGIARAIEALSDVYYGLFQQHEQMDRVAKSMMLKGGLSLVSLWLVFALTYDLFWAVVAMAGAWAAVLVGYDLRCGMQVLRQVVHSQGDGVGYPGMARPSLWDHALPRWHLATLRKLVGLSLPLGLVMLLLSLNGNIPRYFVEWSLGEASLGIFAAMDYIRVANTMVIRALGQAASPRLSRYYATGNLAAFRTLLTRLLAIGGVLGGGLVVMALVGGDRLLTLLYGPSFAYQTVFVWVMLAAGIENLASFFGYAATACRRISAQPVILSLSMVLLIGLCWLLTPPYGLQGAAVSLIGSFLVIATGYGWVVLTAIEPKPANQEQACAKIGERM
jgi:O-antigen/teichoic acid export membrane protein